jgi:Stage II sporulation protein E (SpoIIE)/Phosphoserine phosphatase RsbU, N-terminal domain
VGVEQPDVSSPALAERYAQAFAAHLGEGGESGLGAAYALGREAVAAQVSVLDFADAHHEALTVALASSTPGRHGEIVRAAAEFLRESLSTFEIAARGYHEVQEIARIEHDHIEQLRALADASVAINASLTVEEILQLTADAAREALGAERASIAILAAEPRRPPLGATSPQDLEVSTTTPSRTSVSLQAQGRELGSLEVVDQPEREFTPRDDAVLTQLGQLAAGAIANARLYGRERTIARTLQHSLRPGALPDVPGMSAAVRFNAAGEGVELGGDFYDLFHARDGGWVALIGDIQGKGPEAAAVTALARHTLRAAAAYEHRPSGILTLLHRELREQVSDGRFCTVAYAHMQIVPGHVRLELACGGHPLPLIVHRDGTVEEVGRLGTLLGSDADPLLADVSVELDKGDVIVFYTDGVTEVRRQRREVFGTEQLIELLQTCGGLRPAAVAERIEQAVLHASMGRLRDDMAVLALGPDPEAPVYTPEESDG